MNGALALELFGYLGSLLILVSMLMTSVVKLRIINLIGSAIFLFNEQPVGALFTHLSWGRCTFTPS